MIFYKYCANGNDFIVVDFMLEKETIIKMCHRNFGIGADGIIIVLIDQKNMKMRIYNKDGSEAKMCGNGLRAVGKYLKDVKNIKSSEVKILTLSGIVVINNLLEDITLALKRPYFEGRFKQYLLYNAGNKHALKIVNHLDENDLIDEAKHKRLKGFNVTHIKIINSRKVKILTHENGVGITLSCGSASASTYACLRDLDIINKSLNVASRGGVIFLTGDRDFIRQTSKVELVFKGELNHGY